MAVSLRFIPGQTIRWRKRRSVVGDPSGMDALIAGQVGKRQLQRSRSDAWTPDLVSGPEKAEPITVRRVKTRLAVGSERSC